MGVSESTLPLRSRSLVYWFRPTRRPPRLGRAFLDLAGGLVVAGGVSAFSLAFCNEAASALEGDIDGEGGGESRSMVSTLREIPL